MLSVHWQIKCLFWEASKCHIHFSRINVELFFSNVIFFFFFFFLVLSFFLVNITVFRVSVALSCTPITPMSIDTVLKLLELLPLESLSTILEYRFALQQQQKCKKMCHFMFSLGPNSSILGTEANAWPSG